MGLLDKLMGDTSWGRGRKGKRKGWHIHGNGCFQHETKILGIRSNLSLRLRKRRLKRKKKQLRH